MFKATLPNAKDWLNIVKAISTLTEEGNFHATSEAMTFRSLDASRTAMIDIYMPKEAFDEYECTEDTYIGMNLSEMLKVLKRVTTRDSITLALKENLLEVSIRNRYTRAYALPLLDLETEKYPEPSIEFRAHATLISSSFYKALKDLEVIGDNVKITIKPSEVTFETKGDIAKAFAKLGGELGEDLISIECSEEVYATYNLSALTNILKALSRILDTITLSMSTNMPLRLRGETPEGIRITYYLASRAE